MFMNKRKLFAPCDFLIIVVVALIALCFTLFLFFQNDASSSVACIKINGEIYREISLNQTQDIDLENNGHHASIHIDNGEVYFSFSDCPDKLCVNQGAISRNGESIVCLPGRFSVSIISSDNENDFDAVIN